MTQTERHLILESIKSPELMREHRKRSNWSVNDQVTADALAQLGLHGKDYFSPLHASFLFEYKSLEAVAYFSPLLVRDGVMTLLHFFFRNPQPNEGVMLLLDQRLAFCVPKAWQDNVLFSRLQSRAVQDGWKPQKLLFVLSDLGPWHCQSEELEKIYQRVAAIDGAQKLPIHFLLNTAETLDSWEVHNEMQARGLQQMTFFQTRFQQFGEVVSLHQIAEADLRNWAFVDVNPRLFYYADSYLKNILWSRGAVDLEGLADDRRADVELPLSFFHSLRVGQLPLIQNEATEKMLGQFRQDSVLGAQEKYYRPQRIAKDSKTCTPAFEKMAFEISCRSTEQPKAKLNLNSPV